MIRLAARLGKTLKELERDMGIGEIAEWIASDELDTERRISDAERARSAAAALRRR